MAAPTNLTFPTVAYNSIILNWTKGLGTNSTVIVRKQGSIPSSRTDGTQIYSDTGNAFIDTGLTTNTQYCYALYGADGTEYTEPVTGCRSTLLYVSSPSSSWNMNETSGTTIYDNLGTNNGTMNNFNNNQSSGRFSSEECVFGGCLKFDGTDDYVSTQDIDVSNGTFALWVKPLSIPTTNTGLISKRYDESSTPFSIGMVANTLKVRALVNDGIIKVADSVNNLSVGEWNFVAGTIASNGQMKIYLNGVLESSVSIGTPVLNNSLYLIGFHGSQGGILANYGFNGSVDEVRYYNRVLSDTEIYSLYHQFDYSYSASSWGLDGETRRKPVHILNNDSGQDLSDYQVMVDIPYDSDMQPDFDDIRFTASDGVTPLPYYLESKTNSVIARFWVKVSNIPMGISNVYAYYGDQSLTSSSSGSSTFRYFNDFNSDSISNWTRVDYWNSPSFTVESYTNRGNVMKVGPGSWMSALVYRGVSLSGKGVLDFDVYCPNYGSGNGQEGFSGLAVATYNQSTLMKTNVAAFSNLVQDYYALGTIYDRWTTFKNGPDAAHTYTSLNGLGTSGWNKGSVSFNEDGIDSIRLIFKHIDGSGVNNYAYFDNLRVRKPSVPLTSYIGIEENR
jgi:hypothetical protein